MILFKPKKYVDFQFSELNRVTTGPSIINNHLAYQAEYHPMVHTLLFGFGVNVIRDGVVTNRERARGGDET